MFSTHYFSKIFPLPGGRSSVLLAGLGGGGLGREADVSVLLDILIESIGSRPLVEDLGPSPSDRSPDRVDDFIDMTLFDIVLVVEHRHWCGQIVTGHILPEPDIWIFQGWLHPGLRSVIGNKFISLINELLHETLSDFRNNII